MSEDRVARELRIAAETLRRFNEGKLPQRKLKDAIAAYATVARIPVQQAADEVKAEVAYAATKR